MMKPEESPIYLGALYLFRVLEKINPQEGSSEHQLLLDIERSLTDYEDSSGINRPD